jgi:hypothetical protein
MEIRNKNKPWKHIIFDNFLSQKNYKVLKEFPRLESGYDTITGFRDTIKNRIFLNENFCEKNPQFKPTMKFLNNDKYFSKIFNVDLSMCSLRPELVDDRYPFFHEVHCDHPDKALTILIYIDKDDKQNLASDLYIDQETHHTKLKWKDNGGIGWTIEEDDNKWHGFSPMEYKGVRRVLILNWVYVNKWKDKSQLYLDFRTQPFRFQPKSWNKLNDLERNQKYNEYMDWLGGLNHANGYTDNVNPMKPKQENNLYKKLKAYILLCRRYRDENKVRYHKPKSIKITKQELQNHLQDLQKLVDENFEEILNNLLLTKWITSIFMCFFDLGTPHQKNFYKEVIKKLVLSKIDWKRGRTMFSEDELTNKNWFKKIKSKYKWKSINDINIS